MKLLSAVALVLILQSFHNVKCGDSEFNLKYVHFLFRHGNRSPLTILKDDPNTESWERPLGMLTKIGQYEEYELGRWFRQHYNDFLSEYYHQDEIRIDSTDVTRCLASAQLFAAGVYPPQDNETWMNEGLGSIWFPIPVHTLPIWMDPYYSDFARLYCPRYIQWLQMMQNTPEYQRLQSENSNIESLLYSKSTLDYENFTAILNLADTILIEKIDNLTWPSWISQSEGDETMKLSDIFTWWYTKSPVEIKLSGGAMTKDIMYRMLNVITGNIGHSKVHVNSGHDYTLINVLQALRIFDFDYPQFSAAVSIELYADARYDFFIQVLYKNETNGVPLVLRFPNCAEKCPWQFVWDLVSPYFVNNIFAACSPLPAEDIAKLQPQVDTLYP